MTNLSRRLLAVACAFVLFTGLSTAVAPPSAADEVTSQPPLLPFNVEELRAQGHTGEGVTIAVIDGGIDLSSPLLAGADITVKPFPCTLPPNPEGLAHGTMVTALLANQTWGIAPKAKIIFYPVPITKSGGKDVCPDASDSFDYTAEFPLIQATDAGADIISTSVGGDGDYTFAPGLTYADEHGVIVVSSMGNSAKEDASNLANLNNVVGVASSRADGTYSTFNNYGKAVTITAPGEDFICPVADETGKLTEHKVCQGTSYAAPVVSAALALAKQAHPDASHGQLIRSLTNTATRDAKGWDKNFGWGYLNIRGMLSDDPSKYEDSNPLVDRVPEREPTQASRDLYHAGLIPLRELPGKDYVYRGLDLKQTGDITKVFLGTSPLYHTERPDNAPTAEKGLGLQD